MSRDHMATRHISLSLSLSLEIAIIAFAMIEARTISTDGNFRQFNAFP
jgi:hypothetical protein